MTPLKACVTEVQAADHVVDTARRGIGHWSAHVQAQSDLISGDNTSAQTDAIWKRTRLAGPADQKAYDAAVADYEAVDGRGTCDEVAATSANAADCAERMQALGPALGAGRGGMADWAAHLEAMADHAAGEFGGAHAQQMWEDTYRAAPENINEFQRADGALGKAPACT
ncbi:MAG: hypothetical protein ACRDOY_12820 [Nocardioidaceae bacterium]